MFDEKEVYQLIFGVFLIAYLIAFPTFTLSSSLIAIIFAAVILIPHVVAHKIVASHYVAEAKFKFLEWKRYGLFEDSVFKHPFPIWLVLPIVMIFVTLGKLKLFAIETFDISWKPYKRIGRWFTELEEQEIAIIAMAGPMVNLFFAFVAGVVFSFTSLDIAKEFAILNAWFAFFSLLPFGNLDGTKVLFGGMIKWVFIFISTIAILVLLHFVNVYVTFIIALLLAIIVGAWFLRVELPPKTHRAPLGILPGK